MGMVMAAESDEQQQGKIRMAVETETELGMNTEMEIEAQTERMERMVSRQTESVWRCRRRAKHADSIQQHEHIADAVQCTQPQLDY